MFFLTGPAGIIEFCAHGALAISGELQIAQSGRVIHTYAGHIVGAPAIVDSLGDNRESRTANRYRAGPLIHDVTASGY
ncbi:MAG: hypothetical protein AAGF27_10610 [Pseudomonadota bacterium]